MSDSQPWDVVVVGGGPAGCVAAWTLAKSGLRTALLDRKPLESIGDKVCGDALVMKFLTNGLPVETSQQLLPQEAEIDDHLDRLELVIPSGAVWELSLKTNPILTVDRHRYGQRLLSQAREVAVQLFPQHAAMGPIIEGGRVTGVLASDVVSGERLNFRAKVVIDASGIKGVIRRRLPQSMGLYIQRGLQPSEASVAYREILEAPEPHGKRGVIMVYYGHFGIPLPGYAWFFSKGEKGLNVGLGYPATASMGGFSVKEMYRRVAGSHPLLQGARAVDSRGGLASSRRPLDTAVAPGLLIAGDAAFHIDPLTGQGHATAILAGYWAGQTAISAVARGDYSEAALWHYNQQCMQHFGKIFATRVVFARGFRKVAPTEFDFLGAVIDPADLEAAYGKGQLAGRGFQLFKAGVKWLRRGWRSRHLASWDFMKWAIRAQVVSRTIQRHYEQYPETPDGLPRWIEKNERIFSRISDHMEGETGHG